MLHPMTEMKLKLKDMALKIRELKHSRKQDNRNGRELYEIQWELAQVQYEYRHHHIAYCMVRGVEYDKIENPSDNNSPNWYKINDIKDELQAKVNAANSEWELKKVI